MKYRQEIAGGRRMNEKFKSNMETVLNPLGRRNTPPRTGELFVFRIMNTESLTYMHTYMRFNIKHVNKVTTL